MMIKGVDGCCRQHSGLSPATTQPLAQNARFSDVVSGADQHRADRSTESLGERDGDSVEEAAIAGEVNPGRHMSVPQPSAVQVAANTVVMAQLRHTGQLVQRLYRSATEIVRVLHRDG